VGETEANLLRHRRVRVYESLRSAHLERASQLQPASILYFGRNYDFDPRLTDGLDLHHLDGPRALVRLIRHNRVDEVEVNEPLMLSALKYGLAAVAAVRIRRPGRPRARVVSYAIENADPLRAPLRRLRTPWRRAGYRVAATALLRQVDRLAFGTDAARERYEALGIPHRTATVVIEALSAPCPCVEDGSRGLQVVFVGAFDERKGLRPLLEAWPRVAGDVPGARLHVLGQGPLESELRAVVAGRDDVVWEVDPPRSVVHRRLREAKVSVLWSRPSPTWREQVGLPVVEALSHGCLVVASEQTGIAGWLAEHGHEVVDSDRSVEELAAAVTRSLAAGREPRSVMADLPAEDGRLAADRWLWS